MARPKKKVEVATSQPAVEETIPVNGIAGQSEMFPEATRDDSVSGKGEKLVFSLNENGGIDLGSLREKTRSKVQQAVKNTPELFEIAKAAMPPQASDVPQSMIAGLYMVLGAVEATVAVKVKSVDPEVAKRIFTYSPNEIAVLMEPSQKVVLKYFGAIGGEHQDLLELCAILAGLHMQKLSALQAVLEKSKDGQE